MRNTLLTILICLVASITNAQEKPAYRIFTAEGENVDYGTMLKAVSKADVVFIDKSAIPCMPEENTEWKDISRFLCSRINWREPIIPLEEIKQRKGRMATDYMYIKFYVR